MKLEFMSSLKFNQLTPAVRRPSGPVMVESLRKLGVTVDPAFAESLTTDLTRLNALHQLDFAGQNTAFEHIHRLAKAGTLVDGTPSAKMAGELFALVGAARASDFNVAKCYARTSQSMFSLHHSGEFTRLLGTLAATGKVRYANGQELTWNPSTLRIQLNPILDLWGAINHIAVGKESNLPRGGELSTQKDSAHKGQMANITSRLFGTQFVNAEGSDALPKLNDIIHSYGPMLAEFENHGGAVDEVREPLPGTTRPRVIALEQTGALMERSNLGYVVVPAAEAKAAGVPIVEYAPDEKYGYTVLDSAPAKAETP